jgi:hypothetical protein
MPSPTAFRRGYGIAVGDSLTIGTCTATIRESRVQHIVVREFERYEFPSKITFSLSNSSSRTTPLPKPEAVLEALIRHTCADTDATKLIYSEYGSPYQCKFGTPVLAATEDASQVVITTRGVAIRDHELPTQVSGNLLRVIVLGGTSPYAWRICYLGRSAILRACRSKPMRRCSALAQRAGAHPWTRLQRTASVSRTASSSLALVHRRVPAAGSSSHRVTLFVGPRLLIRRRTRAARRKQADGATFNVLRLA